MDNWDKYKKHCKQILFKEKFTQSDHEIKRIKIEYKDLNTDVAGVYKKDKDPDNRTRVYRDIPIGEYSGFDKKTIREIKNYTLKTDATIDLHNMTTELAHKTFIEFVLSAYRAGHRYTKVITGRGVNNSGKIIAAFPSWCNNHLINHLISAVAQANFGGGSFYVVLKK